MNEVNRVSPVGFTIWRPFFEGPVEMQYFKDAIEVKGVCCNCKGTIAGVIRVPKVMQAEYNTLNGRDAVREQVLDIVQRRHVCSLNFEGKDDVQDFLRRLH